jgi:hypothetical protein
MCGANFDTLHSHNGPLVDQRGCQGIYECHKCHEHYTQTIRHEWQYSKFGGRRRCVHCDLEQTLMGGHDGVCTCNMERNTCAGCRNGISDPEWIDYRDANSPDSFPEHLATAVAKDP